MQLVINFINKQGLDHRIGFTMELCFIDETLSSKIIAIKTEKLRERTFQEFGKLNYFFTNAFSQIYHFW